MIGVGHAIETRMRIGDSWVTGSGQPRPVINPAFGDAFAEVPDATSADVDRAVRAAEGAQRAWSHLPGVERGAALRRVAALIRRDVEKLARLVVSEQGKPIGLARGEVGFAAKFFDYFANFERAVTGEIVASENVKEDVWIRTVPYGVVAGITAWNFPAALFARKVAPAIMAGNTIVVKPHENTPLSALALAGLIEEAAVPSGVVNVICGSGPEVGQALVRHPLIRLVSLTGSVRAGKQIAHAASDDLTVISLELGGKAPFIVMDDADMPAAVTAAIQSRFSNSGQVCTSNERTYVHRKIADEFIDRYVAAAGRLRMGDPLDPQTELGPKVNLTELEKVERMVDKAKRDGAEVLLGGGRPDQPRFAKGYWYLPTVLTNVTPTMEIMQQEVFGPVATITRVADFEESIALANETAYGLSAYVYTNDLRKMMAAVDQLNCGEIYVNNIGPEQVQGFHSGRGLSGYGGEDGAHGLERYLRRKSVYLNYG